MVKRVKKISLLVEETAYDLAKYKFVSDQFPDSQTFDNTQNNIFKYGFKSRLVNTKYTGLDFHNFNNQTLSVSPYYETNFSFGGKSESIRVYSVPKQISLAYIDYLSSKEEFDDHGICVKRRKCLKFSKFLHSMKKNNFSEKCLNDCRLQILEFIKNNSGVRLIDKNLPKRKLINKLKFNWRLSEIFEMYYM